MTVSEWKLAWNAACLCGRVRMRVTAPPLVPLACHCRGCQKLTSGPYSLTLMLETGGFEVVAGEMALGGATNFRPTLLEDASWVVPFVDTKTEEKLPGVVSGARRGDSGWVPPSDYAALLEAYAREGARPAR